MEEILKSIEFIEDIRQQAKVRHKLLDIIVIVLFAKLANADDWEEMEAFAECHEKFLKRYIALENGIPSHDTLQRVMGNINPQHMQKLYEKWNALLSTNEGEKLKKIICIDGKTMRGNGNRNQKPNHIVSAWSDEDGFCLGQKVVEEKSNEITAIPRLFGCNQCKRKCYHHRRNGNSDSDSRKDKIQKGRLCAGSEGEPEKPVYGNFGIF